MKFLIQNLKMFTLPSPVFEEFRIVVTESCKKIIFQQFCCVELD